MKQHPHSSPAPKRNPSVKNSKRELLFDGKETQPSSIDRQEFVVYKFKDDGFLDGKRNGKTKGIGAIKNDISSYLFDYLAGFHIPTHFVRKESDDEMMIRRLEMIPLLVTVYNIAFGEFAARFNLHQGTPLVFPVFEYYHKNAHPGLQWLNEHHMYAFKIATPEEFRQMNRLTSKVNAVLRSLCDRRKLTLVGLKLEFGRFHGQLYVGGDFSPAKCLIWDTASDNGAKRDRFVVHEGSAEETYNELFDRLTVKV
jgi:phosphoribosylaminoimidazole-succinocarboxamide synthase